MELMMNAPVPYLYREGAIKLMINAPIPHLDLVKRFHQHLVLSHLLEEEEYLAFYKDQREKGSYIVLDNGVVETGVPRIDRSMVEMLRPHEVVAPDYLFDAQRTYEESLRFLTQIKTEFPFLKVMCVPQGDSPEEFIECLEAFVSSPCDVIGLGKSASLALTPKQIRPRDPEAPFVVAGRHRALTHLMKMKSSIPVHILGLSRPNELLVYNTFPNVRSVDTSWCFRTLQGKPLTDFHEQSDPEEAKRLINALESVLGRGVPLC
ncbi:hypothetical protein DRO59_03165 [Candidatus Bathyarchaeota archaeon]|nr:MAG: hypothetical protein DRO59_03165 [Candidatus Bathyarchaeota archaeon]